MRFGFFTLLLAWNSLALGQESLLVAEVQKGDLVSRYEIVLKEGKRSLEWSTSRGQKSFSDLTQKDYALIVSEFQKLKSPNTIPDTCHRQFVRTVLKAPNKVEKLSQFENHL